MELIEGQRVILTIGESATVIKELGRGGQGIVYLVDLFGKKMALKWYLQKMDDDFYEKLSNDIMNGAPSEAFIWPEFLTKKENGSFGYIMRLRPENYFEFGYYLLNQKRFKSFRANLNAAMKIANAFKLLHLKGYSYQDLNDGNFFINPETGDVLICDNDNVVANGEKSGIKGKARYMAPEVVAGSTPNKYSDRYSLSVILFMLFFLNHPFEGEKICKCPCMTEDIERRLYGSEAIFIFDENNEENRPVRGIHNNVMKRWPHFPKCLKETFIKEFSREKLQSPNERLIEAGWETLIQLMRDELVVCPFCEKETFVNRQKTACVCMNCSKQMDISYRIKVNNRQIILTKKTPIFLDKDENPDGVITDKSAILNKSNRNWVVLTPSGRTREVAPNEEMPVKAGLKIKFGHFGNETFEGEIIKLK